MPLVDDRTQKIIDALAVLCGACVPLIASGSQFSAELCRVCADSCKQCAVEYDRREMTECAEACRKAAQACRDMADAAA